ncbi:MAG: hypothetical protein OEM67_00510 [Thermoleophilia bacterium]|nr:hypothetical protein [Thermoleophilia bacterium]MDH3725741.1 hypothetical protein [Thermoleophilia bacterium]
MSPDLAVILANLAAAFFMAGMIWTIQIVHYPLLREVGADAFPVYESEHQGRIAALIAAPWAIEILAAITLVVWRPEEVTAYLTWAGLLIALALPALTLFVFAPIHRELSDGFITQAYQRLVSLNWIRTALWSAHAIVAAAILVQYVE